jgi:hypothetical protein
MRKVIGVLAIVLSCVVVMGAQKARVQQSGKSKSVPAAYAIAVHVIASHYGMECSGNNTCQDFIYVDAVVGGMRYELRGSDVRAGEALLLPPGDYKGKLDNLSTRPDGFFEREYSLLLPDDSTWECLVTGVSE